MSRAPDPAFLRPNEAAHYASSSRRWLAKQAACGLLPVIRIGPRLTLYARADLDAFILRHRRGAIGTPTITGEASK